jgi:hypothetical protein
LENVDIFYGHSESFHGYFWYSITIR